MSTTFPFSASTCRRRRIQQNLPAPIRRLRPHHHIPRVRRRGFSRLVVVRHLVIPLLVRHLARTRHHHRLRRKRKRESWQRHQPRKRPRHMIAALRRRLPRHHHHRRIVKERRRLRRIVRRDRLLQFR